MLSLAILLAVSLQAPTDKSDLKGDPLVKAWSELKDAAANKSSDQRTQAIQALGVIEGNRLANEMAEQALKDSSGDVRAAAATSLGQMKEYEAKPALRRAMDDQQVKVVLAAAAALLDLHDPAGYQVYYAVLTGKRKTNDGLIKSQTEMLHNRKQVEKMAFETGIGFVPYAGTGLDVWKQLMGDRGASVKAQAAEKLAKDPDPRSSGALMEASEDDDWRVRNAVANAIARRADPKLLPTVSSMLLDSNQSVRLQAAAAVIVLKARAKSK